MCDYKTFSERPKKSDYTLFLDEYELLIRKHGIFIGGCGCCNSPFTSYFEPNPGKNDVTPEDYLLHLTDDSGT